MKKFILVLMSMLVVLPCVFPVALAAGEEEREPPDIYFEVSNPNPKAGESVFVTLLADNAEGLCTATLNFRFNDDILKYVDFDDRSALASGGVAVGGITQTADNLLGFGVMWARHCLEEKLTLAVFEFTAIGSGEVQFSIEWSTVSTIYGLEPEPPPYPGPGYDYDSYPDVLWGSKGSGPETAAKKPAAIPDTGDKNEALITLWVLCAASMLCVFNAFTRRRKKD